MLRLVDTRMPDQVEQEARAACARLFAHADLAFVSRAFAWTRGCFSGQCDGYQAIDARYHDLEHTLQGTLCLVHLLEGRARAGAEPRVSRHLFELGLLAILFHDTGYLKTRNDLDGTGAKYTAIHVERSAEFAKEFLTPKGYAVSDIQAVQNMIRCTGVRADVHHIPFQSEAERVVGYALATADLLGQMAAPDYVEKLPVLFQEFAEAAQFDPEHGHALACYSSCEELMRRTPEFWEGYVLPRIRHDFRSLYTYLNDPYPDGPNPYLQGITRNIERLRRHVSLLAAS
jgi:hypothetical protein